jgi:hypothetical protein
MVVAATVAADMRVVAHTVGADMAHEVTAVVAVATDTQPTMLQPITMVTTEVMLRIQNTAVVMAVAV